MICGILLITSEIGKPVSRTQSLIFPHWGDNVVIANLVQTQLRLSPNRSRTFRLASTYLRRIFDVPWIYLESIFLLPCRYFVFTKRQKSSLFLQLWILNYCQLWIMNCNSSSNLPSCFPLATFLLPSCYPLATPLLPSCYLLAIPLLSPYYRLTSIPIFYFHRTSTTYSPHIAHI